MRTVAAGSADEVRTGHPDVSAAWGYVSEDSIKQALELLDRVQAMLWRLTALTVAGHPAVPAAGASRARARAPETEPGRDRRRERMLNTEH